MEILINGIGDGNICSANSFSRRLLFIAHPEMVKSVLTGNHKKFPKSSRYSRIKFILGEGLVTSSGDVWKSHRQMLNPGIYIYI